MDNAVVIAMFFLVQKVATEFKGNNICGHYNIEKILVAFDFHSSIRIFKIQRPPKVALKNNRDVILLDKLAHQIIKCNALFCICPK